jgi:hypothetical protein
VFSGIPGLYAKQLDGGGLAANDNLPRGPVYLCFPAFPDLMGIVIIAINYRERICMNHCPTQLHKITAAMKQKSAPLTLEELSAALNLHVHFLEKLGLRDPKHTLSCNLEVPYLDEDGCLPENGLVQGLGSFGSLEEDESHFSERGPNIPYGMWRLDKIRNHGWVLLVKHELDCWILWSHGIPALGIPDTIDWCGTWRKHLEGLEIFVWDEGTLLDPVSATNFLGTLKIMRGPIDQDELIKAHFKGQDLRAQINDLKDQAIPSMDCLGKMKTTGSLVVSKPNS